MKRIQKRIAEWTSYVGALDAEILFQGGHYSTFGVTFFYHKTVKQVPEVCSGENELRGCFGRQNPIPGWALLHFWGDVFLLQNG